MHQNHQAVHNSQRKESVHREPTHIDLAMYSFSELAEGKRDVALSTLPPAPTHRTFSYLWSQFFTPPLERATGLEHLSLREFMAVKQATKAFEFAVDSNLREGWWSSLLHPDLLVAEEATRWRSYLQELFPEAEVVEIGPGDGVGPHRQISQALGASCYVGIDLQERVRAHGGIVGDALEFFSSLPSRSVDVVMAFGVFNEPLSLQYPAYAPPSFRLPAKRPEFATRAHTEHEYVRRLFKAIHSALADGGVVFGDGLYSRGFERDVEFYIKRAGFERDSAGQHALGGIDREKFFIRDPFFFKKQ